MQEILVELFRVLGTHVPDEDVRKSIYSDLIPTLQWIDADGAEDLKNDDACYNEAYEEITEGEDSDE